MRTPKLCSKILVGNEFLKRIFMMNLFFLIGYVVTLQQSFLEHWQPPSSLSCQRTKTSLRPAALG